MFPNCSVSSGLLSNCIVQNVLGPHRSSRPARPKEFRFIRKLPARPSAITLPRTFDSCSAQIRERSSHRSWERQWGAGSNGTNVAWGLSSPPLLASVMAPHSDIPGSSQERGQTRTGQVEAQPLARGAACSPGTVWGPYCCPRELRSLQESIVVFLQLLKEPLLLTNVHIAGNGHNNPSS